MVETLMTSRDVIQEVLQYNDDFVDKHHQDYFDPHFHDQNPVITLVSCSDSRVQPHVILPDAINRIFEIENIGNQIYTCEGSVDYGIYHLHTPLLLILGHSDCGAVKAFMKGYIREPYPIKRELDTLRRALSFYKQEGDFEQLLISNIQKNIDYQVQIAHDKYRTFVEDGKLTILGACYDFRNDFNRGHGRLIVINVNGETDRTKISTLPFFGNLDEELKKSALGR